MKKGSVPRLLEAIPVYAAYGLFAALPVGVASAIGGALLRVVGPLLPSHRTAILNLDLVLPEVTGQARRQILSEMWDNLGRTMAEYPHLRHFGGSPRVEVHGAGHVREVAASGKPAIFFAGHIANWEVPAMVVHENGIELPLIYRAPNNPFVDRLIRRARLPVTRTLVPKGGEGAKALIGLIRSGRSLGMLVDQKMNDGIAVPFFGRPAMTAPAMVKLAARFDLPLYPVEVERTAGARFRVTIHPALELDLPSPGGKGQGEGTTQDHSPHPPGLSAGRPLPPGEAKQIEAMTRINALLESWIRERPGQWLWVHRRWPDSKV